LRIDAIQRKSFTGRGLGESKRQAEPMTARSNLPEPQERPEHPVSRYTMSNIKGGKASRR